MDRRAPLIAVACALATSAAIGAEKAEVNKLLSAAREESRAADHLDHLTNRIGPRLTGSDNLQTACEWARDRFKGFGIANARLERWGEFPVGFNRGPWSGRMVEPETKALTIGTNAWTAGTRGVVRGPAVLAPEDEAGLAKVRASLPGAWVLTPPAPPAPTGPGRGAEAAATAEFRKKLEAAYAEAKVAGVVRGARNDLILTGGNYRVAWGSLPETPAINLVKSQFDEVAGLVGAGRPVVLEFDVRNHFKEGPIPLFNVVADIPGEKFPDEYVIVGGHIDSWDGATGATDNATGCATTLEAARLLMKSGVRPARTIRFMLWSGEEQGLMGSKAYVKAHPELMPKVSAVLVHDGGTNYLSGIGATKAMKADFEVAFAPVVGLDPAMPFAIREVGGLRGGGSDHASFLAAGVPGFFWGQAGRAVYPRTHHTQHDTFDAAIADYQRHSSIVAALGALGIADLDHLLSREAMIAPGGPGGGNRRTLGVQLEDRKVVEVVEGGAAEKAGVRVGDEVVSIGGRAISGREDLAAALQAAESTTKVVVRREGKDVELPLTLPARP